MGNSRALASLIALAVGVAAAFAAAGEEFRITEVRALPADPSAVPRHTIAFTDHQDDPGADPATGLIPFEHWARTRAVQRRYLAIYPSFVEPTVDLAEDGTSKPHREKLHIYVAEARFMLPKAPASVDLTRYVSVAFLERMDPKITHRVITAGDVNSAANRNPDRKWCEPKPQVLCIESRYELEGKLPAGIRLANQLVDKKKKIDDFLLFQGELRLLSPADLDQAGLPKLTGIDAPITGAIEQNIFYVNQVMQFGKFLAVLQPDTVHPDRTMVSAFIALGIKTRVIENKNKYADVPVLRNLVPSQVLVGKSSFNTGTSLSAGLPNYARNEIKAVAGILEQE
jgi:hypothetical protein